MDLNAPKRHEHHREAAHAHPPSMKPLKEILQSGRPPGKVQPVATPAAWLWPSVPLSALIDFIPIKLVGVPLLNPIEAGVLFIGGVKRLQLALRF